MGEYSAMCEKVLRTLENIIERDLDIREFAIVQTTENSKNKSPVLYEENCLGLESWCKSHIRCYSHSILSANRKKLSRKQMSLDDMRNLNRILLGGLLVQPNVLTFWNMKRELVENEVLSIEQELYFSELLLSMYPKSYEAFSYRKWLLGLNFKKVKDFNFFLNESRICLRTACKSPNNYHSWNYRKWCMEVLWQTHPEIERFVLSELEFSMCWISNHVSEYTGYSYRQFLINNLKNLKNFSCTILQNFNFNNILKYLNLPSASQDPLYTLNFLFGKSPSYPENNDYPKYINMLSMLLGDLSFITVELNDLYSKHECLWSYRKFLLIKLLELAHEYHGIEFNHKLYIRQEYNNSHNTFNILSLEINDLNTVKSDMHKRVTSSNFYSLLMKKESEFIEASRNKDDPTQFNLPKRHLSWLYLANIYKPSL